MNIFGLISQLIGIKTLRLTKTSVAIRSLSVLNSFLSMDVGKILIAAPLSTKTLLTGLPSICALIYKGFKCWHINKVGFSNTILLVSRHSSSSANKMGTAP